MYEIARYLSPEARRYAAGLAYAPQDYGGRRALLAGEDCCPLGAALRRDGHVVRGAPDSISVANRLCPFDVPATRELARWEAVEQSARRFVEAWDDGFVPDLARALGVTA